MVYQDDIKQFYQLNILFAHSPWKIRLLGSRCPTIKIIESPKFSDRNLRPSDNSAMISFISNMGICQSARYG